MINFVTGNIFDTKQPAIGHGVNIYGVMGSGIAPLIKEKFPAVFPPYKKACNEGTLKPGMMLPVEVEPNMWIFNLASQDKPGRHAKLAWVQESLENSFQTAQKIGITGFAIPRIGAGIGGLKWENVVEVIETVAQKYPDIMLEVVSLPTATPLKQTKL